MPRLCRPPPQSPCLGLGAGLASLEGGGWGTPVPFARGNQGRGEGGEQRLPCLLNTFCLTLLWLWVEAQAGLKEQAFTAHHVLARRPRSGCCRCVSGGEGSDFVLQATSQGREGARVFSSSSEGTDPTRGAPPSRLHPSLTSSQEHPLGAGLRLMDSEGHKPAAHAPCISLHRSPQGTCLRVIRRPPPPRVCTVVSTRWRPFPL